MITSAQQLPFSADRLSPFKFYQFLLTNTTDKDVIKFLRMLTFVSLEDIENLEKEMGSSEYKPNTAQKLLAREVTKFVHGPEGLKQAEAATEVSLLSSNLLIFSIASAQASTLDCVSSNTANLSWHSKQAGAYPIGPLSDSTMNKLVLLVALLYAVKSFSCFFDLQNSSPNEICVL